MNKVISILILSLIFLTTTNVIEAGHGEEKLEVSVETPIPQKPLLVWSKLDIQELYEELGDGDLNYDMFEKGLIGMQRMVKIHPSTRSSIITLIDFDKPSNQKRLFLIDLYKREISIKTYVAHGRASGDLYATNFSNTEGSHKSSLGFYLTAETYQGKHGYSMRLDGVERGLNDNARNRAIVMHSADYVCKEFIQGTGRLGRSLGCPALSANVFEEVIGKTKNKSCLFVYHSSGDYFSKSEYVNYDLSQIESALVSFYHDR